MTTPTDAPNKRRPRRLRRLIALLLLMLFLVLTIFSCAQVSLWSVRPGWLEAAVAPFKTANYGPWESQRIKHVDPALGTLVAYENMPDSSIPLLANPLPPDGTLVAVGITATATQLTTPPLPTMIVSPTGTLTVTPSQTTSLTASVMPPATHTASVTSTETLTATVTETPSPTQTLTYTPTTTLTPTGTLTLSSTSTAPPVALFMASPLSGAAPLAVTFSNVSSGYITSYAWNFGDGVGFSNVASPIYTYTVPGTYTATLTVSGSGGSSTYTTPIVVNPPLPVASFYTTPSSGTAPLTVNFTNTSPGIISGYSWAFGDGISSSNLANPAFTYTNPGTYVVTLTVLGPGGTASSTGLINVTAPATTVPTNTPTSTLTPTRTPTATNTPAPNADLVLTISVSNATPAENEEIIYTLTLTNNGTVRTTGVQVTDVLPGETSHVSNLPSQGSYNPASGVWVATYLNRGASAQLQIRARVNTGTGGRTVTNVAYVTASAQPDPNPGNNTASSSILVASPHLLNLTGMCSNNPPVYRSWRVQNANAYPVTFDWQLVGSGQTGSNIVPAAVGGIPGEVFFDTPVLAEPVTMIISVSGVTHSTQASNSSACTNVDLVLGKVVDNLMPYEGDPVTFTITLINNGPDNASIVQITDLLSPNLTYFSNIPSAGTYDNLSGLWLVGGLPAGGTATLRITAYVNGGTAGIPITNTASITSAAEYDPDPSNNSAGVTISAQAPSADLVLSKTVSKTLPIDGETIFYTVTLINNGPRHATGILVTDQLPPFTAYVSYGASQGNYNSTNGFWDVGGLDSGANAVLTINATVSTGGNPIINTATISAANQTDPAPTNNIASVSLSVQPVTEPNIGEPNGTYVTLNCGQSVIVDMTAKPIVTHPGYDFVYYENASPTPGFVELNSVRVDVGTSSSGPWSQIFFWGNATPDTNTLLWLSGYGASGEPDAQDVPMTNPPLYGSTLITGIVIDVDAVVPAGTYTWVRFRVPNSNCSNTEIDSMDSLP